METLKAADIPDEEALFAVAHMQTCAFWATIWDIEEILPRWPTKVLQAKMSRLIQRGLIDGCDCGCRGDYQLTELGAQYLADHGDLRAVEAAFEPSHGDGSRVLLDRILGREDES